MIFIKNPLVFCSASSHERRIVPDEWWETWEEYNGWNTGSCSGREVDSWSKLYKPNTKVFYVLSSGVYFYNEGHTKEWGGCASRVNESITDLVIRTEKGKNMWTKAAWHFQSLSNHFTVLTFWLHIQCPTICYYCYSLQSTAIIAVPVLVNVTRTIVLVI